MFEVALSLLLRDLECLGPLDSDFFLCLSSLLYIRIVFFSVEAGSKCVRKYSGELTVNLI